MNAEGAMKILDMPYMKYYHASIPHTGKTLCGLDIVRDYTVFLSHDPVGKWLELSVSPVYGNTKCQQCLEHPDLPFYALAEL